MNEKLTVLITGTSSGLGRKFAGELASKGHDIRLCEQHGKMRQHSQLKNWARANS